MTKEGKIFIAVGTIIGGLIALDQYNKAKERGIKEKKVENEKRYFDKLTPEQVEAIETKKLEVKASEIELKKAEAELKKTVTQYEEAVRAEIERKVMTAIHDDMRDTFDTWSTKFEDRLDNKVDRVVSRIDDLSDKYGGVKGNNAAPSINVVNAPNN